MSNDGGMTERWLALVALEESSTWSKSLAEPGSDWCRTETDCASKTKNAVDDDGDGVTMSAKQEWSYLANKVFNVQTVSMCKTIYLK